MPIRETSINQKKIKLDGILEIENNFENEEFYLNQISEQRRKGY